ncbi:PREDICTED: uncharacterized protein LOC104815909 isoform X2 [Tarenaya hassleriana]|uniref:uncharacterized protein LOC104815909 isoform X2 n=1 Tax=Tarenaya hassleriana TaxID=28532 RepID=UPI00053C0D84|nr:PREDICTED: uncharacterized protein LOC104815909 isoform X2 [Tarenaya hassleriana]
MASSHLGASSLINSTWMALSSSVKLWVGFRDKRFRRYMVVKRRRFRVRQMYRKDQRSKRELVRLVKRSESLRRILKQYGVSVDNLEETNGSSSLSNLASDEQPTRVPSSVLVEKLPDSSLEENHHENVNTSCNYSGQNLRSFPHLETDTAIAILLPTIAFCIACILGAFRGKISRNPKENPDAKTPRDHHPGSKRTRWRSVLGDWSEPHTDDEQESSQDHRVTLGQEESPEEVSGGYSRVEHEYQRFLSECGITEHGYWRGGSSE